MHILIVEDEQRLARLLSRVLGEQGHRVELAFDGETGLELGLAGDFDLIVLDLMLPKRDGLDVCRSWRTARVQTPVLMLTARDTVTDRVRGLDAGADDYLVKPFAMDELLARVRALGRRAAGGAETACLRVGDLSLDRLRHEVRRGDTPVHLSAKEFDLLEYLMSHTGQVLTRDQILDHVWRYDFDGQSNVVDLYVYYLRQKLDRLGSPLIHTVRGVGYVLRE
jgi:DNA-binding response OmpR family regulator